MVPVALTRKHRPDESSPPKRKTENSRRPGYHMYRAAAICFIQWPQDRY